MKKRLLAALLCAALLLCTPALAAPEESPFSRSRSYDGRFSDIGRGKWYDAYAVSLYEYGLTEGRDGGVFAPNDSVTLVELLVFSARVRAAYENGGAAAVFPAPAAGERWYEPYLNYLRAQDLLRSFDGADYAAVATRAQMAGVFHATLPASFYDGRNAAIVEEGAALGRFLTDVEPYTPYRAEILDLYVYGLVNGVDAQGNYHPNDPVARAEVAAILSRMLDPTQRLTLDWDMSEPASAQGRTLASLIDAPATPPSRAPRADDTETIDALIREMLAADEASLTLRYDHFVFGEELHELNAAFLAQVRFYSEQMYNRVSVSSDGNGRVVVSFASSFCSDAALAACRDETMARAIAVHDALWADGYLTAGMSEREKAYVYYVWLAEHCAYDYNASDDSPSHLAHSALCCGIAVCDGYTGAYDLFLKLEGIECTTMSNSEHIWTIAVLDGETVHIDATWGDVGTHADPSYFAMSERESYRRHPW